MEVLAWQLVALATRGWGRPAAAGPTLPASCWQPRGLEGWDTVGRSVLGFRTSGTLLAPPSPCPPLAQLRG
eukprot:5882539-Alexandrium_andersonii.AAC.1